MSYTPKDLTGALFFDSEGAVTMSGNIQLSKKREIKAEPSIDKRQQEYVRITGQGISGALYPNERKSEDRHPEYTGPLDIDGQKYRLSAWVKQIRNGDSAGKDFYSLAFSKRTDAEKRDAE